MQFALCLSSLFHTVVVPVQVRAPMPPSYMFVIDVSVAAVACGMLTAVVDGIKSALDDLVSADSAILSILHLLSCPVNSMAANGCFAGQMQPGSELTLSQPTLSALWH